jgi:hypothetical protein
MFRRARLAIALALVINVTQVLPPAKAADCTPTVTTSGAYTILKFTTVGSCTYQFPATVTRVEYLVVGGGGGGGNNAGWGGGGGSYTTGLDTTPSSSQLTITIGDGGAGGVNVNGPTRDGQDGIASSVVFPDKSVTALGGLGGPTYWSDNTCNSGYQIATFSFTTGGRNGGAGGIMGVNGNGGTGGNGYSVTVTPPSNIEASNYENFAGGGGGGVTGSGSGGSGTYGGGNGAAGNVAGTNATANTGGGGGGGGDICKDGGKGGSGIVILRYLNSITYPNKAIPYPTVTGTLASRYIPTNFNGLAKTWTDVSSYNNHITDISGSPYLAITDRNTAGNVASDQYAVTGITTDKFMLPYSVASTYTVFYVARYTSSTPLLRQRILSTDASATNWLSGFYSNANGVTGVAYHGGWITQSIVDGNGTSTSVGWVISTDQQALHRSQRSDKTTNGAAGVSQTPQFAVNRFNAEISDWQIVELIVYSNTLSSADIQSVENYLYNQYFRGINYSSLTVAAGATPQYRVSTAVTVNVRTQSRVTYKVNGKVVPGCNKVLSTSTQATCNWLPSIHSQQTITATATPLDSKYDETSSSASVYVVKRSAARHS